MYFFFCDELHLFSKRHPEKTSRMRNPVLKLTSLSALEEQTNQNRFSGGFLVDFCWRWIFGLRKYVESPLLIGGKKFAESSETALVFLRVYKMVLQGTCSFLIFFVGGEVLWF